jgi:hypothetical protein
MGLDDRDYMRERYRKRRGLPPEKNRFPPRGVWSARQGHSLWRYLLPGLSLLMFAIPMFEGARRRGWLPDREPEIAFPDSGSVTVARALSMRRVTSSLEVQSSDANAIVQFLDPDTKRHVISIYVRGNDRVRVPVPRGTYQLRLIEGVKWHGPERFFGPNTAYETVAQLMQFQDRRAVFIDLRRTPSGNLPTRLMMSTPDKL